MKYYIPEEVVEEILLRLPSKCILRFESVCKSWYILINSKMFINNHLEFKRGKSKRLVLGWTCLKLPEDEDPIVPTAVYDFAIKRKQMMAFFRLDNIPIASIQLSSLGYHKYFTKGSHCNGIICVVNTFERAREMITFSNPALSESRKILSKTVVEDGAWFHFRGFGFWYDDNDYKYIRLLTSQYLTKGKAEVYSLGTDCWREIKVEKAFHTHGSGLYHKGFLYWLEFGKKILSLDVTQHKFVRYPLPYQVGLVKYPSISVWNESIIYLSCLKNNTNTIEMWIMNNDVTWTKHVTMGPFLRLYRPMLFWNDEELVVQARDSTIFLYNLNTKLFRIFIRQTMAMWSAYAHFLTESLVSVKPKIKPF